MKDDLNLHPGEDRDIILTRNTCIAEPHKAQRGGGEGGLGLEGP